MKKALDNSIIQYNLENKEKAKQAIQEVIQSVVLEALSHTDFFKQAALYGGTALRLFYDSRRFSEDLHFVLIEKNDVFVFSAYFSIIIKELELYGIKTEMYQKNKTINSDVQTAFISINLKDLFNTFEPLQQHASNCISSELLKIKIEIDINHPTGAGFEIKSSQDPIDYSIRLFDLPSLFAGKISAILCRNWGKRVKGRDFYDYSQYLKRQAQVNLEYLKNNLVKAKKWNQDQTLSLNDVKRLLLERFETINYELAKQDAKSFVFETSGLAVWSADFFKSITLEKLH